MQLLWSIAQVRTPALTYFFQAVTFLGDEIFLVVLACALYWCVNRETAFGLCISFFLSALLVQGLKIVVRMDRPWVLDPAFMPVASALKTATGYSFPSGHTQSAAAIFGYLGIASGKKKWIVASWALVLLVGFSRMYLGVHTLLDVLGAIAISLASILITRACLKHPRSDALLPAILLGLSLLVLALALFLHGRSLIETVYLADCCKAAGGCIGCTAGFLWARRIPFQTRTPRLWQQVLKLLVGLVVLVGIKSGLKAIFGESLALDALRYFLIALWALAVYPLLFMRLYPTATDAPERENR
ncbi:phosphatase PAP2 family protein [Eubacteriales bacterium OttesenSCG-928-A19]|nr:phosphatase PAP2 family protein [Eubacteriales bacterium OttesenSCG-928-A19]